MDFQFYFFFNLPNNNVGGSVNQSIIKKGLSEAPSLELQATIQIDTNVTPYKSKKKIKASPTKEKIWMAI